MEKHGIKIKKNILNLAFKTVSNKCLWFALHISQICSKSRPAQLSIHLNMEIEISVIAYTGQHASYLSLTLSTCPSIFHACSQPVPRCASHLETPSDRLALGTPTPSRETCLSLLLWDYWLFFLKKWGEGREDIVREGNEEWDRKKVRQQEYGNELRRNGDGMPS